MTSAAALGGTGAPATADDFEMIRAAVRRLCDKYGNSYWRSPEPDCYPEDFVAESPLYQVAPVNNNLVPAFIAQKCLGLPKSH